MDAAGTRVPLAPPGAFVEPGGTRFRVWTTRARAVRVRIEDAEGRPLRTEALDEVGAGVFERRLEGVGHGALYRFELDGEVRTDPYARFLPHGVHGPACVIEPRVRPRHPLRPLAPNAVIVELHVGAFTPTGTFRAAIERLGHVVELGAHAIQLMPVAAFPGTRGWGYDGVGLFAPFAGYGAPDDLRELVDAAHGLGLSVLLDVVYNHLGPSGNYLGAHAPEYFRPGPGPWGAVPDFTAPRWRALVIDNALYWLRDFGFDGLRLDATHAIEDPGPVHILAELADEVHRLEPRRTLIAEDDRNHATLVSEAGLDAILADDFHHSVHVGLTGERDGYYRWFEGTADELARIIERGWRDEGEERLGRTRGGPAAGLGADHLVYCLQNHDQVGNRAFGERLGTIVDPDAYAAATVLLLTLPMRVLLFMGQEWAARTPFLFFTDHDEDVAPHVNPGRIREFTELGFQRYADPVASARIHDAQDPGVLAASRLRWEERDAPAHARVLALHRELLRLRREDAVLAHGTRERLAARAEDGTLIVDQWLGEARRRLRVRFDRDVEVEGGEWSVLLRTPRAVLLGSGDLSPGHVFPTANR